MNEKKAVIDDSSNNPMVEFKKKTQKRIDKEKIASELLRLNAAWWKKLGDETIYKAFTEQLRMLEKNTIELVESHLFLLKRWATEKGHVYERLHRFQTRITLGENIVDLKINIHDYEFYVFVNDMPKKIFEKPGDIQPWLEEKFPSQKR